MLQLKNATPFAAEIAVFPNEKGIDTLYTMVKASFVLADSWTLAEEQVPPQMEDEYWGDPGLSSIKIASDFHTGKPATDISMIGDAYAPFGQAVKRLDAQLVVGHVSKTIRVIGDRFWESGEITEPKPFTTMPVVYEHSFGGRHVIDDRQYKAEERNPVGRSFVGKRSRSDMNGVALPNIEDPNELIKYLGDAPPPAGFGFCSPDWLPRRQFAGTYDDAWQNSRAPYLPMDFDSRFLNAAHPDLVYPGFLIGGENVVIKNMHPDGELNFVLPEVNMRCDIKLNAQTHTPELNLETLILQPNEKQVSMVWRAAFECDKKVLNISEIEIKLSR